MKPKDKAKQIVDSMWDNIYTSNAHNADEEAPKNCAKIVVNEILQTNPTIKGTSDDLITMIIQTKAYWYQVLSEIDKL